MAKERLALHESIYRKFLKRSWHERFLFFEAYWRLGAARFQVLVIPFKRIAPSLGCQGQTAAAELTQSQVDIAHRIGWAIRAAARRTPWESNCLAQAVDAKKMLQQRHIPSTLYLGVRKTKEAPEDLDAHAWIVCGESILTGKHRHQEFTVISQFGDVDSL